LDEGICNTFVLVAVPNGLRLNPYERVTASKSD